jgi:hypothetical protein
MWPEFVHLSVTTGAVTSIHSCIHPLFIAVSNSIYSNIHCELSACSIQCHRCARKPNLPSLPFLQSTTYIIPYPQQPQYQFQYQWWIIEFEFFAFCWSLAATAFPSILHRLRPVALTFIASALVLVMDNINALFFLIKNDTAKAVFDEYRINVALAGLILVGAANFMTIIFLGLYDTDSRPEVAYKEKDVQKGAETA